MAGIQSTGTIHSIHFPLTQMLRSQPHVTWHVSFSFTVCLHHFPGDPHRSPGTTTLFLILPWPRKKLPAPYDAILMDTPHACLPRRIFAAVEFLFQLWEKFRRRLQQNESSGGAMCAMWTVQPICAKVSPRCSERIGSSKVSFFHLRGIISVLSCCAVAAVFTSTISCLYAK